MLTSKSKRLTYQAIRGEGRLITLHLSDFQKLQASKRWRRFLYLSENQPGYACAEPLKADLAFYSMTVVATPPTAIYFGEGGNRLWLNFVTAVDCGPHVLGDLLKVSCRDGQQYIIVAQ